MGLRAAFKNTLGQCEWLVHTCSSIHKDGHRLLRSGIHNRNKSRSRTSPQIWLLPAKCSSQPSLPSYSKNYSKIALLQQIFQQMLAQAVIALSHSDMSAYKLSWARNGGTTWSKCNNPINTLALSFCCIYCKIVNLVFPPPAHSSSVYVG